MKNSAANKNRKLYLIPTPLSTVASSFLLPEDAQTVSRLTRFIAEDPKKARAHLKSLAMETPIQQIEILTFNEHTHDREVHNLVKMLNDGIDTGLMSDAGVPGVADPGAKIVRLAHMKNIEVIPMVGPSSILLALMASGLNGQRFTFEGYIPVQQDKREEYLLQIEEESFRNHTTHILIETPYRNKHLWNSILNVCHPNAELSIAVDLTAPTQFIKTAKISDWKKLKWPDINKKPVVFLLNSRAVIE